MPQRKRKTWHDLETGDRVFAIWWPERLGKIIRQGKEVSEIQWDDRQPMAPYVSTNQLRAAI